MYIFTERGNLGRECVGGLGFAACYGECMDCSGAAGGVNALIVIIFPFAMLALYRVTTNAGLCSEEGELVRAGEVAVPP